VVSEYVFLLRCISVWGFGSFISSLLMLSYKVFSTSKEIFLSASSFNTSIYWEESRNFMISLKCWWAFLLKNWVTVLSFSFVWPIKLSVKLSRIYLNPFHSSLIFSFFRKPYLKILSTFMLEIMSVNTASNWAL